MSLFRPLLRVQRSLPTARAFSQTASNSIAKINIVGRLGAPPELVPSGSGNDLVRYALATSYGKGREKTSWFKVAYFPENNPTVKSLLLGLGKGSLLWVEGDAYIHTYDNREGQQQSQLRIVQRTVEILERRGNPDAPKPEAEEEEEPSS